MQVKHAHQFENHHGQGLVSIKPFPIGDYLYSEGCNTVTWYDCRGSVGKYVAHIAVPHAVRIQLLDSLCAQLNSGNTPDWPQLTQDLEVFCRIFPKGKLGLSLLDGDGPTPQYGKYDRLEYVLAQPVRKQREKALRRKWRKQFAANLLQNNHVAWNLIERTTSVFYDGMGTNLIFTQPEDSLNADTIKAYESQIRSGKRPIALVYTDAMNYDDDSDHDNNYVLDGHHKLMAYRNLGLAPHILEINQISRNSVEMAFDPLRLGEELGPHLFEWQLRHVFDNTIGENHKWMQQVMATPENPLAKFVKHDFTQERWSNGNLKRKGNYIENRAEGIVETFHESGRPQAIHFFKDGRQYRTLKAWYDSGELRSEFIRKDDLGNGEQISYYRDGKVSCKTVFKNGLNADGTSSVCYFENGKVQYSATFKDGLEIGSRHFGAYGEVVQSSGIYREG